MNILVTGATGYVGSRVATRLAARGHSITALARSAGAAEALQRQGYAVQQGSLARPEAWIGAAQAADAVVHTAFDHAGDFFSSVEVERTAVQAVLDALREKVVASGAERAYVGTNGTGILGDTGPGPAAESAPIPSESENSIAARARVEALVRQAARSGVRGATVRLPILVYGHGGSQFVPALIALARAQGTAYYVGDGTNRLSAVHVDDAAEAFVRAVERLESGGVPPGLVFHAAAGAITGRELAGAVAVAAEVDRVESVPANRAADVLGPFLSLFLGMDNRVSSSETRRTLGWEPTGTPLLDDLRTGSYATADQTAL